MTMRTPGDDIELAAGFLVSEAAGAHPCGHRGIKLCDGTTCGHGDHDGLGNIADVTLAAGRHPSAGRPAPLPDHPARAASAARPASRTSASCRTPRWHRTRPSSRPVMLARLPDRLREAQRVFSRTGGLHAAGLFTADGELIALREDVGRHNAVDKVVGWALLHDRLPLTGCVCSSAAGPRSSWSRRPSWPGIPLLAAVSAPSSLAAELAEESRAHPRRLPLRGPSMNVYTGAHRIVGLNGAAAQSPASQRAAAPPN